MKLPPPQSILEYLTGGIIAFAIGLSFTILDRIVLPFRVPLLLQMALPLIPFGLSFLLFALGNKRMAYGALAAAVLVLIVPWWMLLP